MFGIPPVMTEQMWRQMQAMKSGASVAVPTSIFEEMERLLKKFRDETNSRADYEALNKILPEK